MINILETVTYSNPWNITFYYVSIIAILIGLFWTYIQVFVKKPKKKKDNLKENIIYKHSEDVIEQDNNYKIKNNNKKS